MHSTFQTTGAASCQSSALADGGMPDSMVSILERFRPPFDEALANSDILGANRNALQAAEILFPINAAEARVQLWQQFYVHLKKKGVQYQCYDFEAVDYELYRLPGIRRLLRGPSRSLLDASGRYVTFLGAAQFFGRHLQKSPPTLVEEKLGIRAINLSFGGAGPEVFHSDSMIKVANCGLAVVLQVLSAKGIGCDEYPGGNVTRRKDGSKVKRLKLLQEVSERSRNDAVRLTRRWQSRYIESLTALLDRLTVPVVLVWMSNRNPDDWSVDQLNENESAGAFPQLVDKQTFDAIASRCTEVVELCRDTGLPYKFVSRFTGENCPSLHRHGGLLWENRYYPSPWAADKVSSRIAIALKQMKIGC